MKSQDNRTVSRESDKFMLRLPDGMRDRIAEEAKTNNRSMNAEIIARLQQTFENSSPSGNLITMTMDDFDAVIDSAIQRALESTHQKK